MPLPSYCTKPLQWLRAGYPPEAPRHGYIPLIALMPSAATQIEDPLDAEEHPVLLSAPHPADDTRPYRTSGSRGLKRPRQMARTGRRRDPRARA